MVHLVREAGKSISQSQGNLAFEFKLAIVALRFEGSAEFAIGRASRAFELAIDANMLGSGEEHALAVAARDIQRHTVSEGNDSPKPAGKDRSIMAIVDAAKRRVQGPVMPGPAIAPSSRPAAG